MTPSSPSGLGHHRVEPLATQVGPRAQLGQRFLGLRR